MRRPLTTIACAALIFAAACANRDTKNGNADGGANNRGEATASNRTSDPAKLDAEIERLQRQVERNPADEDASADLSTAYMRRGDANRAANRLKEALQDYRHALRVNPDNEEALGRNAELTPLVEGTPQPGEFGEPEPIPISPDVVEEASPKPVPGKKP